MDTYAQATLVVLPKRIVGQKGLKTRVACQRGDASGEVDKKHIRDAMP